MVNLGSEKTGIDITLPNPEQENFHLLNDPIPKEIEDFCDAAVLGQELLLTCDSGDHFFVAEPRWE
jgi:hypothetical protein